MPVDGVAGLTLRVGWALCSIDPIVFAVFAINYGINYAYMRQLEKFEGTECHG